MEARFGSDFSDVRVHTDRSAAQSAEMLQADAYTTGRDIYFGAGQYAPQSDAGQHLLAHELTHTVQQSEGSVSSSSASMSRSGLRVSQPNDPLEQEAEQAADIVTSPKQFAPPVPTPSSDPQIQREEKKSLGQRIVDKGKEGIEWAIRKVAPELADLIVEGPVSFIRKSISKVVQDWIPGFFKKIDVGAGIQSLMSWFSGMVATIKGAFTGDSKTCAAFAQMMASIRDFANKVLESEAFQTAKRILTAVNDAVGYVVKLVLAPQFEMLKDILGGAWSAIKAIADTVSGWISKAKAAVVGAWNWIAGKLGLDGDDSEGVWAWIKKKASSIWTSIKETLGPVVEPISSVAKALSIFTPMGQISFLVEEGPKIVKAVKWLWEHRNDKDIIRNAHEQMKDTYLPQLLDSAHSFRGAVEKAFSWVVEKATAVGTTILSVVGAISGVPLLSMAKSFFDTIRTKINDFMTWAQEGLQSAAKKVKDIVQGISDFIAPYKEILSSVAMAILNPPMIPLIIGGWVWRKLDTCIKRPIIEFFFDIVVKALEALPDLPFLGPLWSIFKAGILGFLKKLAGADYAIKEKICDKVAKIMSGASPDFILGFVGGFLEGIWDGITDPFKAIWTVLEGLHWVQEFLTNLMAKALGGGGEKSTAGTKRAEATPAPAAVPAAAVAAPPAAGGPAAVSAQQAPASASAAPGAGPAADIPAEAQGGQQLTPELQAELGQRAGAMLGEIGPDIDTVQGGFWDAAKEYFSGGDSISFDDLSKKLGEAWGKMLKSIQAAGADLGAKFIDWLTKDTAEEDLGNKLGWLAGSILFQMTLD
jgi:hypothetical protein